MVKKGAELNTQTLYYKSALHKAATSGNDPAVTILLEHGATVPDLLDLVRTLRKISNKICSSVTNHCTNDATTVAIINKLVAHEASIRSINNQKSLQEIHKTLVSIDKKLAIHKASMSSINNRTSSQEINKSAIILEPRITPIKDLTKLSQEKALAFLEKGDYNDTLNNKNSDFNIIDLCSNQTQRNLTLIKDAPGGNNDFILFEKECINMNLLVDNINSTDWGWAAVLGVTAAAGGVVIGALGGLIYYLNYQHRQYKNYQAPDRMICP